MSSFSEEILSLQRMHILSLFLMATTEFCVLIVFTLRALLDGSYTTFFAMTIITILWAIPLVMFGDLCREVYAKKR